MNSDGNRDRTRSGLLRLFSVPAVTVQEYHDVARKCLSEFLSRPEVALPCETPFLQRAPFNGGQVPFSDYFEYVLNTVIPHSINMASPRCMGHMTTVIPGFLWPLAEIVIALNQNLVKMDASRLLTALERQALATLHELVYERSKAFYAEHTHRIDSTLGMMTAGGTLSNISALWVARNTRLGPCPGFAGVEAEGIAAALKHHGYERTVVLGSQLAHYSIQKAIGVLGLGERNLLAIPVDEAGRMHVESLRTQMAECRDQNWQVLAIIANAGSTDCGSIDPLAEIGEIAREAGTHFHVDAAWGLPLMFSERHRHLLAGIELANSVTVDAHKQFHLPLGNSLLLLRDPTAASVIEKQSRYLLQRGSGDLGSRSLEGSRPGSGLLLHAALQVIGRQGYAFLVEENLRKSQYMAARIEQRPEFALLVRPKTNILLYRYIPPGFRCASRNRTLTPGENGHIDELNLRLQSTQRDEGRAFVSRTTIEHCGSQVVALRAVIVNPLLTEADIDYVLQDQAEIAARFKPEGAISRLAASSRAQATS